MSSHRKNIDSVHRGRTMKRDQRKYSGNETTLQTAPIAGPSDSATAPIPAFAPYGYPQPQQPSRSSYGNAPPPQKSAIQQQPLPPAPQLGSSPPLPKSLTQKPLAQQSSRQPPPSGSQQPHPTQQQPPMPYPYPQPFPDPRLQGFPGAPPPPGFVPAGAQFPQPFQYISYPPQHYGVPPPFATGPAPAVTPHHLQSPYSAVPPNVYPPPSFQTGSQTITPQARPPTAPESKKPRRPRSRNSNSSGSSTSSSLLNVSRVSPPKEPTEKGFFKRFFTAGSQKKSRRRRRSRRRRHVAGMPNSSSSSLNSDLAYGHGYVDRSSESSGSESDTTRQTHHPQYMYPSIPYVASPYGPHMYYAPYPIPAPLPGQHPYGHSRHPSDSTNHTHAGTAMAAGAVAGAVGGAMFNHLTSTSASTTIVNQQRSGGSTPKAKKPKDKKGKQKARPMSGDDRKTLNDSSQIDSKLVGLQKQLEHLLTATQEYDSATSQRRELLRNGSQGAKSNGKNAAHFTRPYEDSNSEWEDADDSESDSDSGSASSSSDGLAYGNVIPIPVKTSTQAYNTRGSELPYYSHSNNPSNQAGFRRTSARSSYSQSALSSNVNVPLQQPRPTHPLGSNIFDLRSPPENKPSRTGTSSKIAPIGIVTGAIGATLAAKAFSESQEVKKKTATQTSYESSKAGNSFSGYGRQEGDGHGRPYSSGKGKAVESQHVLERPQPQTVKYDAHTELSSKASGKITRSTDSRMNPFQYQVAHDAFKTPHSSPPQAPNRHIQEKDTSSKTKLAATVIAPAAAVTTAAYLLSESRSSKTEKRTRVEEVNTTECSTEVPALPPRIVPKPEGHGLTGYKTSHTPESIRYPLKSAMKGGTAGSVSRSSTSSPRAVSIAPPPSSREVKERTGTMSLACVTENVEQKSERATQELHERDIRIAQEEAKKMQATHEAKRAAQEAHDLEVRIAREEEERLKAARRAEQVAHEALVAERLAKEARDREARERAERAEVERRAKEAHDREARRKAEKAEAERIAKERAERLEAERAANEAAARKAAREARDREARIALEEARKAECLREKMEAERIAIEAERAAQRAREAEEAAIKRAAQEALEAERAAEEARRAHAREVELAAFKAAEEARMIQEEEARAARETLARQRELEASRAAEEARLNQEREATRAQEALAAQQAIEARNAQIAAEEARELERIAELRRNEEAEARRAAEESERVREMKRISVEQETTSAEESIRQVEEDRTFNAGSDEQALQSSLPCSFPEYPSHHIFRFPSNSDDDNEPVSSQTVNLQDTEDGIRGRSQGIRHDELTVKVDQSRSRSSSSSSRGYPGRESVGSSDSGRQSRYHSPNADVRIDNIISHPKDLPSILPPQPSGLVNDSPTDAQRPLLNIIRPTPEVSPARSSYISNDLDAIQERSEQADDTEKTAVASETKQQQQEQQQQSSSAESPSSPKHRRWFSGNVFGSGIIGIQRMKRSLAKDEVESECTPVVSGPEETPATEGLELVPPAGEEDVISDIDESHESVPAYEPSSPIASHSSRSVSGEVSIDAKLRGTKHDADPVTDMPGGLGDIEFSATLAAGLKMSGLDDSLATHESMHQRFTPPGHDPQLEPWRPSANNESISHSRPIDVPENIAPAQACPSENPADKNLGSVTSTPMSTGSDPNAWGNSWRSEDPKRLSRAEQRAKRRREKEKAQKTQAATADSNIDADGSSDIESAVDSPSTSTDNFQDAVSAVSDDTIHQQGAFLDNADIPSKDVGSVDTTEHAPTNTEDEENNEDVSVTAARPASSGSEPRSVVCLASVDPVSVELEAEPTVPKSPPLIDPAVAPQRRVKPAIDPSYGDLLLLPPSDPNSPEISPVQENLPPLPDSRPETPPEERRTSNPAAHHRRKSSAFDTPTRSPSSTAFPIVFRSARAAPDSPAAGHCSPSASPTLSRRSRHSSVDRTIRGTGTLIPLVLPPLTRHEHQTSFSSPEGDASVDVLSSARRSRSKSDFQKSASSFDFSMNPINPNRISECEQQSDSTGQPASMDLSPHGDETGFDPATMGLRPLILDQETLSSSSTAKVDAGPTTEPVSTTEPAPTSSRPGSRRMSGPLAFGLGIEHSGFVRHSAQLDTDVDDEKPETIVGAYEVSDSLSRPVTPTMPIEDEPLEAHGTETEVVPVSSNGTHTPDPATLLGDVTIEPELINDELPEFPGQSDPDDADGAHSGVLSSPDLACKIPLPADLDEDFAETAAEARPSEVTPSETEDDFQDAVSYSDTFTKGVSASIVLSQPSEPSRSPPTTEEPRLDAPSIVSPTLTDPGSPNIDDNGLAENTDTSPKLSKKEKKRRKKARKAAAAAAVTAATAAVASTVSSDNLVAIETSVVEEGHEIESDSLATGQITVLVEEDREASDTVASYEPPVTATILVNDKSEAIPSECPTFDGMTARDSTGKELIEGSHSTPKVDDFSVQTSSDLALEPSFRELKSGDGLRESHEQENDSLQPAITTTGESVILHDPLPQGLEPAAISEASLETTSPLSDPPLTALEIRPGQIDRSILEDERVVEPSTKIGSDSTSETQPFYEAPKAGVGSVPEEVVVPINETPTLMEHTPENLQVVIEPEHKDYSIEVPDESVYDSGINSFAERGLSPVVEEVEEDSSSVVHDRAGTEYSVQLPVLDVESVVDRGIVAQDIPLPESPVSESAFMDESLMTEEPVCEIDVRSTVEHSPSPIPEAAHEGLLPTNQYDLEPKALTQTSVPEDKPDGEASFVSSGSLDIEEVSGVDKTHKLEEATVFQTTPAVHDMQIADKSLIVEESLVAEETPAFETTPIFHEAQGVENTYEDHTDSRVATHILEATEAFGSVHEATAPPTAESITDTSSGFAHTQDPPNINVESTSAVASDESAPHVAGTLDPKSQQTGDVGDITDDVSSCVEQPEALDAPREAAYGEKSVLDGTPHVSTEGPSTQPVVDMIPKLSGEIPTVHESASLVISEDALVVESNVSLNIPERNLDYQPQATPEIHNASVSVEIKTPLVEETLLQPEASDIVVEEPVSTPKFLETSVVPVDGLASESVAQSSLESFAQSPQSDSMEQTLSQPSKVMTPVLSSNTSEASVYDFPPLPLGDDDELDEGPNIRDISIGLVQETAQLELQDSDTLDIEMPDAVPSQEANFMVQEDTTLPDTDAKADIEALVPPEPEAICEADISAAGTETDHNLTPRVRASVPATDSINSDTEPDFKDLIFTGIPTHATPAMTNPQSQLPRWTGIFSTFNKPGQIAGNLILPPAGAPAQDTSQPPSPSVDTTVGEGASEDDVGSVTSSHVQEDDEQPSNMPVERLRKGLPPPSSVLLGHKSWATMGAHRHIRGLAPPSSSSTPTDELSPELANDDFDQAASTAAGSVDGDVESVNSPIETANTDAIIPEVHISTQPGMIFESPLDGLRSRETLESLKLENAVSAVEDVTSERAATIGETMFADAQQLPSFTPSLDSAPTFMTSRPHEPMADSTFEFVDGDFVDRNPTVSAPHVLEDGVSAALDVVEPPTTVSHNDVDSQTVFPHESATRPASQLSQIIADSVLEPLSQQSPIDERYTSTEPLDSPSPTSNVDPVSASPTPALVDEPGFNSPVVKENDTSFSSAKAAFSEPDFNADPIRVKTPSLDFGTWTGGLVKAKSIGTRWRNKALRKNHDNAVAALNASGASGASGTPGVSATSAFDPPESSLANVPKMSVGGDGDTDNGSSSEVRTNAEAATAAAVHTAAQSDNTEERRSHRRKDKNKDKNPGAATTVATAADFDVEPTLTHEPQVRAIGVRGTYIGENQDRENHIEEQGDQEEKETGGREQNEEQQHQVEDAKTNHSIVMEEESAYADADVDADANADVDAYAHETPHAHAYAHAHAQVDGPTYDSAASTPRAATQPSALHLDTVYDANPYSSPSIPDLIGPRDNSPSRTTSNSISSKNSEYAGYTHSSPSGTTHDIGASRPDESRPIEQGFGSEAVGDAPQIIDKDANLTLVGKPLQEFPGLTQDNLTELACALPLPDSPILDASTITQHSTSDVESNSPAVSSPVLSNAPFENETGWGPETTTEGVSIGEKPLTSVAIDGNAYESEIAPSHPVASTENPVATPNEQLGLEPSSYIFQDFSLEEEELASQKTRDSSLGRVSKEGVASNKKGDYFTEDASSALPTNDSEIHAEDVPLPEDEADDFEEHDKEERELDFESITIKADSNTEFSASEQESAPQSLAQEPDATIHTKDVSSPLVHIPAEKHRIPVATVGSLPINDPLPVAEVASASTDLIEEAGRDATHSSTLSRGQRRKRERKRERERKRKARQEVLAASLAIASEPVASTEIELYGEQIDNSLEQNVVTPIHESLIDTADAEFKEEEIEEALGKAILDPELKPDTTALAPDDWHEKNILEEVLIASQLALPDSDDSDAEAELERDAIEVALPHEEAESDSTANDTPIHQSSIREAAANLGTQRSFEIKPTLEDGALSGGSIAAGEEIISCPENSSADLIPCTIVASPEPEIDSHEAKAVPVSEPTSEPETRDESRSVPEALIHSDTQFAFEEVLLPDITPENIPLPKNQMSDDEMFEEATTPIIHKSTCDIEATLAESFRDFEKNALLSADIIHEPEQVDSNPGLEPADIPLPADSFDTDDEAIEREIKIGADTKAEAEAEVCSKVINGAASDCDLPIDSNRESHDIPFEPGVYQDLYLPDTSSSSSESCANSDSDSELCDDALAIVAASEHVTTHHVEAQEDVPTEEDQLSVLGQDAEEVLSIDKKTEEIDRVLPVVEELGIEEPLQSPNAQLEYYDEGHMTPDDTFQEDPKQLSASSSRGIEAEVAGHVDPTLVPLPFDLQDLGVDGESSQKYVEPEPESRLSPFQGIPDVIDESEVPKAQVFPEMLTEEREDALATNEDIVVSAIEDHVLIEQLEASDFSGPLSCREALAAEESSATETPAIVEETFVVEETQPTEKMPEILESTHVDAVSSSEAPLSTDEELRGPEAIIIEDPSVFEELPIPEQALDTRETGTLEEPVLEEPTVSETLFSVEEPYTAKIAASVVAEDPPSEPVGDRKSILAMDTPLPLSPQETTEEPSAIEISPVIEDLDSIVTEETNEAQEKGQQVSELGSQPTLVPSFDFAKNLLATMPWAIGLGFGASGKTHIIPESSLPVETAVDTTVPDTDEPVSTLEEPTVVLDTIAEAVEPESQPLAQNCLEQPPNTTEHVLGTTPKVDTQQDTIKGVRDDWMPRKNSKRRKKRNNSRTISSSLATDVAAAAAEYKDAPVTEVTESAESTSPQPVDARTPSEATQEVLTAVCGTSQTKRSTTMDQVSLPAAEDTVNSESNFGHDSVVSTTAAPMVLESDLPKTPRLGPESLIFSELNEPKFDDNFLDDSISFSAPTSVVAESFAQSEGHSTSLPQISVGTLTAATEAAALAAAVSPIKDTSEQITTENASEEPIPPVLLTVKEPTPSTSRSHTPDPFPESPNARKKIPASDYVNDSWMPKPNAYRQRRNRSRSRSRSRSRADIDMSNANSGKENPITSATDSRGRLSLPGSLPAESETVNMDNSRSLRTESHVLDTPAKEPALIMQPPVSVNSAAVLTPAETFEGILTKHNVSADSSSSLKKQVPTNKNTAASTWNSSSWSFNRDNTADISGSGAEATSSQISLTPTEFESPAYNLESLASKGASQEASQEVPQESPQEALEQTSEEQISVAARKKRRSRKALPLNTESIEDLAKLTVEALEEHARQNSAPPSPDRGPSFTMISNDAISELAPMSEIGDLPGPAAPQPVAEPSFSYTPMSPLLETNEHDEDLDFSSFYTKRSNKRRSRARRSLLIDSESVAEVPETSATCKTPPPLATEAVTPSKTMKKTLRPRDKGKSTESVLSETPPSPPRLNDGAFSVLPDFDDDCGHENYGYPHKDRAANMSFLTEISETDSLTTSYTAQESQWWHNKDLGASQSDKPLVARAPLRIPDPCPRVSSPGLSRPASRQQGYLHSLRAPEGEKAHGPNTPAKAPESHLGLRRTGSTISNRSFEIEQASKAVNWRQSSLVRAAEIATLSTSLAGGVSHLASKFESQTTTEKDNIPAIATTSLSRSGSNRSLQSEKYKLDDDEEKGKNEDDELALNKVEMSSEEQLKKKEEMQLSCAKDLIARLKAQDRTQDVIKRVESPLPLDHDDPRGREASMSPSVAAVERASHRDRDSVKLRTVPSHLDLRDGSSCDESLDNHVNNTAADSESTLTIKSPTRPNSYILPPLKEDPKEPSSGAVPGALTPRRTSRYSFNRPASPFDRSITGSPLLRDSQSKAAEDSHSNEQTTTLRDPTAGNAIARVASPRPRNSMYRDPEKKLQHSPFQERTFRDSPLRRTPTLREPSPDQNHVEPQKNKDAPMPDPINRRLRFNQRVPPLDPESLALDLAESSPAAVTSAPASARSVSDSFVPRPLDRSATTPLTATTGMPTSISAGQLPIARRSISNTSLVRQSTPALAPRPGSSSSTANVRSLRLRRTDRRLTAGLRGSQSHNDLTLNQEGTERLEDFRSSLHSIRAAEDGNSDPIANEGRVRAKEATKDDAEPERECYEGLGDAQMGSPMSSVRPHSMRRRQSMQVIELTNHVNQLIEENQALMEERQNFEVGIARQAAAVLTERNAEIDNLKHTLIQVRKELSRIREVNSGLKDANNELSTKNTEATREIERSRAIHEDVDKAIQERDQEIANLRSQLEESRARIRELQAQILASAGAPETYLHIFNEDHFDTRCNSLFQHIQQWVLRFSKFSDMHVCRPTVHIHDEKILDRLDNAVLDGTNVDHYLRDRVKRRDVFMSVTMNMVWEFVFTRFLFGMDREQRGKLKQLEKHLSDIGPPAAVRQWRAITLTLLSRRENFRKQRHQDTEAVVQAILLTLSALLPPPQNLQSQIQTQLRRVMHEAVDLSMEMRRQKAEYKMLPPPEPEYDTEGELVEPVPFRASTMHIVNSSKLTETPEQIEARGASVRMVLFPLVVKKANDAGEGDEEIVVFPAQVILSQPRKASNSTAQSSENGGVSVHSQMPPDDSQASV
ncbi:hypothetical protein HOO65_060617 [Ceratocystis lukuohia]|uniref:Uncharacterized protein n=1 Tax=Ceratocystis lukuohia TaxID=2019550 RepID=A0ABR4MEW4_9PEZI